MDKKRLFQKIVSFTASFYRVTHELTKDAKADFVTPAQYDMLEFITVNQPVTPSEISDCLYISMPNTSRELRKLSEKNLIEKYTDSIDKRRQLIRLSKEGEKVMDEAFAMVESHFIDRIKNASEEDLEEIERAMDILQRKFYY